MRTHLIPLTVALTLVSATAPTAAQDMRGPTCFAVIAADSDDEPDKGLKLRLEAALGRYAPLCNTLTGEYRPVMVNVVVMLDRGYYYASHFILADTDVGFQLQRQSMQLHAQTLDQLVDHIVTGALDILKSVQS